MNECPKCRANKTLGRTYYHPRIGFGCGTALDFDAARPGKDVTK